MMMQREYYLDDRLYIVRPARIDRVADEYAERLDAGMDHPDALQIALYLHGEEIERVATIRPGHGPLCFCASCLGRP